MLARAILTTTARYTTFHACRAQVTTLVRPAENGSREFSKRDTERHAGALLAHKVRKGIHQLKFTVTVGSCERRDPRGTGQA